MNYDFLVNSIVEELYNKINDLEIYNKPKAVVLWPNSEDEMNILRDEFEVEEFSDNTKNCDLVVISRLCMRGLCNLATGNSTSQEERFILKMLMKGKKVFILENNLEYRRYKKTAPKALYNKYVEYEREICKYGINLVKDVTCITLNKDSRRNENNSNENNNENPKYTYNNIERYIDNKNSEVRSLDFSKKRLISESDLRKIKTVELKEVIVNKKTIITPLASDFIRIHHLNLIRV